MSIYQTGAMCVSCRNGNIVVEVIEEMQETSGMPTVHGPSPLHSQHTEYRATIYCSYCEGFFRGVRGTPDKDRECIEQEEADLKLPKKLSDVTQSLMDDLKAFEDALFTNPASESYMSGC